MPVGKPGAMFAAACRREERDGLLSLPRVMRRSRPSASLPFALGKSPAPREPTLLRLDGISLNIICAYSAFLNKGE